VSRTLFKNIGFPTRISFLFFRVHASSDLVMNGFYCLLLGVKAVWPVTLFSCVSMVLAFSGCAELFWAGEREGS
jgi:hypothetical protein